ncbi:hypothetical protein MSP8887_01564 [Marinomonas spartinae]|uniref:Uridine kinase n=1 Tax=Marinomonas spartinae TaxID=1792290 RepID=A0A1A8TQ20_9GAMM|nr:uridine kinase [Marinomonas spartinae]SBS31651.1 hypothetical protein MSP8887_01564 [Marinomonas spartinae]SBS36377.1 hypothetical protein MSP8886_03675 [Marinomonas spartinae]
MRLCKIARVLSCIMVLGLSSSVVFADATSQLKQQATPQTGGAELFGLKVNDLSKQTLEKQLSRMGLQPYPSYKKDVVSYSLGPKGILGIKELDITFNDYDYIRHANLAGVVKNTHERQKLGELLEKKYGEPNVGFIKNGYGRARWYFKDGTYIELHNTTFDVSISYVDEDPKVPSESGTIDVEALSKQTQ